MVKAGHVPADYEYLPQTRDVYRFDFESAGALEFVNEHSGLAVAPAAILASQNSSMHVPLRIYHFRRRLMNTPASFEFTAYVGID